MAVEEVTKEQPQEEVLAKLESVQQNVDNALESKIIRQVEYYFGDLNLTKDKFMQEEIQKEEGCKWLLLYSFLTFYSAYQLN